MREAAAPKHDSAPDRAARLSPPPWRASWKTRAAKRLLHGCGIVALARAIGPATCCARILCYHAVTDDLSYCGPDIAVSPAQFERHLAYLSRWYRVIPLARILDCLERQVPFPERAACITFDDGYLDNYRLAFPLLRRYELPATFFVTADPVVAGGRFWVGWLHRAVLRSSNPAPLAESFRMPLPDDGIWTYAARRRIVDVVSGVANCGDLAERNAVLRRVEMALERDACADDVPFMMNGEHLREIAAAGMTIGSHSLSHPILASLPDDEVRTELERSRDLLEAAIDSPVDQLAYPNGPGVERNFNAATARLAAAAGYRGACTSIRGTTDRTTDTLALTRHGINQRIDFAAFAFKLEEHRFPLLVGARRWR